MVRPPLVPGRAANVSEALLTPRHARFWALVLGGMYTVFAVAHAVSIPDPGGEWMLLGCLVAVAAYLLAWFLSPRHPNDEAGLERQLGYMFTIAALLGGLDVTVGGSSLEVIHPVMVMVLTGAVVYRSGTIAAVILTSILGVVGGALRRPDDEMWLGAAAFVLGAVGVTVALHVDRAESGRRLREAWSRLQDQAVLDPLTGLANRRGFLLLGEQLLSRARRDRIPLALVFIDIDRLKLINDQYGHAVGDQVIKAAGRELRRACRDGDVVARLGGDEFAVLAYNITAANLPRIVERLHRSLTGLISHVKGDLKWTASVGVAPVIRVDPGSLEQAVASADRQMYIDKRARRGEPGAPPARVTPPPPTEH